MSGGFSRGVRGDPALEALSALRDGRRVWDRKFDQLYPKDLRATSSIFWTPVAVARRAAAFLAPRNGSRVLDVGCGGGKFCLVGALTTLGRFVGVEHDAALVSCASKIARCRGIERVRFVNGSAFDLDWRRFDSFYFYNPFFENRFDETMNDRAALVRLKRRYERNVTRTEKLLRDARAGTRVATYFGFGGKMPPGYEIFGRFPYGGDVLELWEKG